MASPKSKTTEAVNAISREYCAPPLKERGFRRRSPHFFRESNDVIHGIHFQASQWGSHDSGSFTVNLCVTAEPLYRFWTGKSLPRNPATSGWPIQVRLGDVCPEGHDLWWSIDSRTNIEKIGDDVSKRLADYAVPFFDAFDTIDDIRKSILSDNPPAGFIEAQIPLIEAMFHTLEGNSAHAAAIIEAQRTKWDGHPFLTAVTTIGERLLEPTNG